MSAACDVYHVGAFLTEWGLREQHGTHSRGGRAYGPLRPVHPSGFHVQTGFATPRMSHLEAGPK
jgi:hypothetical protein